MKGTGVLDDKFPAYFRSFLRELIKDPRLTTNAVGDRMAAAKLAGHSAAKKIDLKSDTLQKLLRFRIDIEATKHPEFSATSFLDVELIDKGNDNCFLFIEEIVNVPGVIEWDLIDGKRRDVLVRVVNMGNDLTIREDVRALKSVKEVTASEVKIVKSGIVDNFSPDDFFEIETE